MKLVVCLTIHRFLGENYLEQTIQIVINQIYDNVDCIVIDGGSTDGKIDYCKSSLNQSV
jgi:glycosyltransferase involved in cell wall biosynthesis